jgi:hypothetical protein
LAKANNKQIQEAAASIGLKNKSNYCFEAIEEKRLSVSQRNVLIAQLQSAGYRELDVTDRDWTEPIKVKIKAPKVEGTKFTRDQMQRAFDMVRNTDDWKKPVNKSFKFPGERNLSCLDAAIIHLTGSVPTICITGNRVKVTAAGYYKTIRS